MVYIITRLQKRASGCIGVNIACVIAMVGCAWADRDEEGVSSCPYACSLIAMAHVYASVLVDVALPFPFVLLFVRLLVFGL